MPRHCSAAVWLAAALVTCLVGTAAAVCGDGYCDETCATCPGDCGPCQPYGAVHSCRDSHAFALTFDDGPAAPTSRLLDILAQHNVKASFFVIGVQVAGYSSVVDRAVQEGHWMASHTWSHPYLSSLSSASIRSEMLQTEEAVRAASCVRPKLMRPPYGDYDGRVETVLHDLGYIPLIWNLDTNDWQGTGGVMSAIHSGLSANNPNPILHLQHDRIAASVELVPQIINAVRGYGYRFVTVDECVYGAGGSASRTFQLSGCSAPAPWCGDGTCTASAGETCSSCTNDCGTCGGGGGGGGGGGSSGGSGPVSPDGRCADNSPVDARCPDGQCCSQYGWCGSTSEYCTGGSPPAGDICGDGRCGDSESCDSCAADCECPGVCGDFTCDTDVGETCTTCTFDCGPCEPPPTTHVCGDDTCSGSETCSTCAADCGPCHSAGAATQCVNAGDWALTFDDGPSQLTPQLLDILADKGVQASFFVVGDEVRVPGRGAIVDRAAAEGHWIGNHGDNQVAWDTMTDEELKTALAAADASIRSVSCFRPRLVRPPMGRITSSQQAMLTTLGYKVVDWSLDTQDFGAAATHSTIITTVSHHIHKASQAGGLGSVIQLQHDREAVSIGTVATIIDLVRAAGYSLVTLDECLYGRGQSSLRDFQVQDCPVVCGDGRCDASEDCSCADCGCTTPPPDPSPTPGTCGDGVCGGEETCSNCCQDCGTCGGGEVPVSTDGRCGTNSPVNAACPGAGCCSQYGWCGTSSAYCNDMSQTPGGGGGAEVCPPLPVPTDDDPGTDDPSDDPAPTDDDPAPTDDDPVSDDDPGTPPPPPATECSGCWPGSYGPCMHVANTACFGYMTAQMCPPGTVACAVVSAMSAADYSVAQVQEAQGGHHDGGAVVVTLDIAAATTANLTRDAWAHASDVGEADNSLMLRVAIAQAAGISSANDVSVVALQDMGPGERRLEGDRFGNAHPSSSSVRVQVAVAVPDDDLAAASAPGGLADRLSAAVGTKEFAALLSSGIGAELDVAQSSEAIVATSTSSTSDAVRLRQGAHETGELDDAAVGGAKVEWLALVAAVGMITGCCVIAFWPTIAAGCRKRCCCKAAYTPVSGTSGSFSSRSSSGRSLVPQAAGEPGSKPQRTLKLKLSGPDLNKAAAEEFSSSPRGGTTVVYSDGVVISSAAQSRNSRSRPAATTREPHARELSMSTLALAMDEDVHNPGRILQL